MLDNVQIAECLEELASLLELANRENAFRSNAYRKAAGSVRALNVDVGSLIDDGRIKSVPGIGKSTAAAIEELYTTGNLAALEEARASLPPGALKLSEIPGLTLRRIGELQTIGVTSTAKLEEAARAGKLRTLHGFGMKLEREILEVLKAQEAKAGKYLLVDAQRQGIELVEYLMKHDGVLEAVLAGDIRRYRELVNEIRIVASVADDKTAALDYCAAFKRAKMVRREGDDSCELRLFSGVPARVVFVGADGFGAALVLHTGADAHIEQLKEQAATKGLQLSANGLERSKGKKRAIVTAEEESVYEELGLQYVPPELREGGGEVQAALDGLIPDDLVTVEDIKGIVHCHTTHSDGRNTVLEMAQAADQLGMKYITITDHSPTAHYANGVTADRLKRQWDEIAAAQEKVKVKILRGTESDILADGTLDYPDSVLESFDVIVASVHNRYKMSGPDMTSRLLKTMRLPYFKIWGHALGRQLDGRAPFDCDVPKILDAMAESKCAVEINGHPNRLDMEPRWVVEARKRGIPLVISTDAHSVAALVNFVYATGIARRAGVRKSEVLNTRPASAFAKAVRPAG